MGVLRGFHKTNFVVVPCMHTGALLLRYASPVTEQQELLGLVSNYTQQVPTFLWFHAIGRNMLGSSMLRVVGQQYCVRLHGP